MSTRKTLNLRSPLFLLLSIPLISCDGSDASNHNPRIAPDAYLPVTPDQYPSAFEKLGSERFEELNNRADAALELMANQARCDGVEIAGISDTSTKAELAWYGHCFNGEKIIISERNLEIQEQ